MTEITVVFKVEDNSYNDYEDIIDTFMNDLQQIGIEDVDVTEKEVQE